MTRTTAAILLVLVASAGPVWPAHAQLSGSNLLAAQLGNYPGTQPDDRHDLYNGLDLGYGFGAARLGLRYEFNRNSEEQFQYQGVTQRWAEWGEGPARLRVGTFFTIFGRGLIHRSFELPGVVLDQIGIRSRYLFSRDMDGALGELNAGPVSATLFSGSANAGTNSLAAEDLGIPRHAGQLEGGQLAVQPFRAGPFATARVGAGYVRSNVGGGNQQELGTGFAEWDPLAGFGPGGMFLPLYFEYAQANRSFDDWWSMSLDPDVPHALYVGTGLVWGRVGLSAEWKEYAQFRLGTNDPPSLVREHTYTLLNRATHVLDPGRETGYQFELTATPHDWTTVTANVSRGDGVSPNRYREAYLELRVAPPGMESWDAAVFGDAAEDQVSALDDSRTYGGVGTVRFLGPWASRVDFEHQTAEHPAGVVLPAVPYENLYLSWAVSRAEWGSFAVIWERTSDPVLLGTFSSSGPFLHLLSWEIGARLDERQQAVLRFGKSPGGRACTAGTCYEVPPFEGAELRWIARF